MIWSTWDLRTAIARWKWHWGAAGRLAEASSPVAEPPVAAPAPAPAPADAKPRRPARRNRRRPVPLPRYSIAEMCAVLSALAEQQRQGVAAVNDVMAENHFAAHPTIVDGTNTMARTGDVLAAVAGLLGTLRREAAAGGDVAGLLRRMP